MTTSRALTLCTALSISMEKNRTVFITKCQGLLLYSKIKCMLRWAMMHNCIVTAGWFSVTNCILANKVHSPEITQCGTNEWHWNNWRNQAVQWYMEFVFLSNCLIWCRVWLRSAVFATVCWAACTSLRCMLVISMIAVQFKLCIWTKRDDSPNLKSYSCCTILLLFQC